MRPVEGRSWYSWEGRREGIRERDGRVVAKVVDRTDRETLQSEVLRSVAAGSTVCTDEYASYVGLDAVYDHKSICHSAKQFVDGMATQTA